ncbi:MAG: hypothetical protein KJ674_02480 [Nanoarchaeota archaeon]|nr:hypothetical protein [Nanoarchaeota archaeon]
MDKRELYWKEQLSLAEKRQDSVLYKRACDELGILPSLEYLYDAGCAELMYQESEPVQRSSNLERVISSKSVSADKITNFLKEANRFYSTSFNEHARDKAEILMKYFPRFRPNGSQSLSKYNEVQIGSIFNRLIDSYKKG